MNAYSNNKPFSLASQGEQEFFISFGKRLATIRKKKGITQEKLAEIVEVHRTYIGFIEQGKRNPSIGNIHRIAKALKVDVAELVKGL